MPTDPRSGAFRLRKRHSRRRYKVWFWLAMLVPTPIVHRLPLGVREFIYERGIRGI